MLSNLIENVCSVQGLEVNEFLGIKTFIHIFHAWAQNGKYSWIQIWIQKNIFFKSGITLYHTQNAYTIKAVYLREIQSNLWSIFRIVL